MIPLQQSMVAVATFSIYREAAVHASSGILNHIAG